MGCRGIAIRITSILLALLLLSGVIMTPAFAMELQDLAQETPESKWESESSEQMQEESEDETAAEEQFSPELQVESLISAQSQTVSISDDDLFFQHPTYLDNDYINEGYGNAEAACFAVLNSYSGNDEVIAACMQILKDGIISTSYMHAASQVGIIQSRYDRCLDAATRSFLKQYLPSSTRDNLAEIVSDMESKYKVVKDIYSYDTAVAKATLVQDLSTKADLNGIHLSRAGIEKVADKIYSDTMIKNLLDTLGNMANFAQIAITLMELYSIEVEYLDFLLEELEAAGLQDHDLYIGISTMKAATTDPATYIWQRYVTKDLVTMVVKNVKKLFNTASSLFGLVESFASMFAKYVYEGATADDLITCYQHMGFCATLDNCIVSYRKKFMRKAGTQADKEQYLALFAIRNAAYIAALEECSSASKKMDQFRLGGDCLVWASNIQSSYNVDNYLSWCKSAIQNDIANGTINSVGETIITDALNEQTIAERLAKLSSLPAYQPNVGKQWSGKFDGVGRSLGFAAMVFNTVFDKIMSPRVDSRYQYQLVNEANVRKIGQLKEGEVTAAALKTLFADARIGDVVISSGKDDYCHAMILLSVNENSITVYDCNSRFHGTYDTANIIQQYDFSYDAMAGSFNSHGSYSDMAGIAVYRAIRKISTSNSGSNLYYKEFDDSVNYVVENGVLTAYKGSCSKIEIPDGVTEIAADCFKNKTFIKYVYMPDTVTILGSRCFYGCTSLQYVQFSNALQTINSSAFYNCKLLGGVILPDSVTEIQQSAFYDCSSLELAELSNNLVKLGGQAFGNCEKLKQIFIPKSLSVCSYNDNLDYFTKGVFSGSGIEAVEFEKGIAEIPNNIFIGCYELAQIEIPDTVTRIGSNAFLRCSKLADIVIPDSVTEIGQSAFKECESVEHIVIPESVTKIERSAFCGCESLEHVELSHNLVSLGGQAFGNCEKLKQIFIPKSLSVCSYNDNLDYFTKGVFSGSGIEMVEFEEEITEIPNNMFIGCYELAQIVIPDTVTSIGSYAFLRCTKLTDVVIPDSVTEIGRSAFYGCSALEHVELSNNLVKLGGQAFWNCEKLKQIFIPKSLSVCSYNDNLDYFTKGVFSNSGIERVEFEEGISEIPNNMFIGCDELAQIEIPDTVTKIGSYAFLRCTKLTDVVIPDSVTEIGRSAFNGCAALGTIRIPDSVIQYGNSMFSNCSSLIDITLSKNCLSIPASMFYKCLALTSIEIPEGVTKVNDNAFYECSSLETFLLPDGVQSIAKNVFYGCSELKSFTAGFELTSIGNNAFYGCKKLTDVKLNQNLTSIGQYAFYECAALKTIVIPDRVNFIGSRAFQKCTSLTDITLPHDLIVLREYTFANCNSLAEIVIPEGVTTIQNNAFYQDTKLTSVTIPASVTSISNTDVISYPTKTTIHGYAGSTAERYAVAKKAIFVALDAYTVPLTLADGSTTLTIGCGVTMRPKFNRDDIVSLSSDNSAVQVKNGMWLYSGFTRTATITATTASGEQFTFTAQFKKVTSVSAAPMKVQGYLGMDLDTDQICVTAEFADGTSCPVTYYSISGYSNRAIGERDIVISYGGATCRLTAIVSQPPTEGILGSTIRWRYDMARNALTFSGEWPQKSQIIVALYAETGRLLEVRLIQDKNAVVALQHDAVEIKCFLVNDSFVSLCKEANIAEFS